MTISNWILVSVLVVLVIAFLAAIIIVKRKARDLEGVCGINHGKEDDHLNDHLL